MTPKIWHMGILVVVVNGLLLLLDSNEGRESETSMGKRTIDPLPPTRPLLEMDPATRACALSRNPIGHPSVTGTRSNQLSPANRANVLF